MLSSFNGLFHLTVMFALYQNRYLRRGPAGRDVYSLFPRPPLCERPDQGDLEHVARRYVNRLFRVLIGCYNGPQTDLEHVARRGARFWCGEWLRRSFPHRGRTACGAYLRRVDPLRRISHRTRLHGPRTVEQRRPGQTLETLILRQVSQEEERGGGGS